MALSPTPNMALQKAEPSVTPGPTWAQMLNEALDVVDSHDHSAGNGARITPAGLNINADVEFNGNDATEVRSTRFENQGGALVGTSDRRCIYAVGDNLYYNNSSGAAVQITSGTAVVSSISGAFTAVTPGGYPYTVSTSDAQSVLLVDTNSARTITLPAATDAVLFCIKDATGLAGTNNISLVPDGFDTIDGTAATYKLNKNFGWWFIISDGVSAWYLAEAAPEPIPAGSIQMFGGTVMPPNWLLCNGAAVSRTTYARLFAVVGTAFGVGDGSTTFNLPDMRQRFPIGKAASGTGSTLGGTGGAIDHTHSVPAHYHGVGTGADIAIGSSGAHTHSIDHNHASVTSGTESATHTHSIDHNHASVTSGAGGAHYHFMVTDELTSVALSGSAVGIARSFDGAGGVYAYDLKSGSGIAADKQRTSSESSHTHDVDLPNFTGTSGNASATHTHDVDLPNFTGNSGSTAHTHAVGDFTGRIGLVTGGVDGNSAMTSGTGNPPFLSVNFIIKT